jgi:hypothetical protein
MAISEQESNKNVWTQQEANGDWRKLYNKELHHLHSSPNII